MFFLLKKYVILKQKLYFLLENILLFTVHTKEKHKNITR